MAMYLSISLPKALPLTGELIQGAGTAVDFGLKVVTELEGKDKADEVAKSICHGTATA